MPQGLQVYQGGVLILDTNSSITHFTGDSLLPSSPGTTGSINVPAFASGRPFYLICHSNTGIANDLPYIAISGNNINYDTGPFGSVQQPRIYYGTWGLHRNAISDKGRGLQVFNSSGYLIFDAIRVPFILGDKKTVLYSAGTDIVGDSTARLYSVNTTVANPIVAFAGSPAQLGSISDNGDGTWRVSFFGSDTDTSATFTLYIFGSDVPAPVITRGIETYDASGNILFNSGMKPIRIYNTYDLTGLTQTLISSGSMPSGISLAVIQCRPFTRYEYIADGGGGPIGTVRKLTTSSHCNSANGVGLTPVRRGVINSPVDSTHNEDGNGYALVIDVSNY